jgi:hypothetical protein
MQNDECRTGNQEEVQREKCEFGKHTSWFSIVHPTFCASFLSLFIIQIVIKSASGF